jgi:hypothetical protein
LFYYNNESNASAALLDRVIDDILLNIPNDIGNKILHAKTKMYYTEELLFYISNRDQHLNNKLREKLGYEINGLPVEDKYYLTDNEEVMKLLLDKAPYIYDNDKDKQYVFPLMFASKRLLNDKEFVKYALNKCYEQYIIGNRDEYIIPEVIRNDPEVIKSALDAPPSFNVRFPYGGVNNNNSYNITYTIHNEMLSLLSPELSMNKELILYSIGKYYTTYVYIKHEPFIFDPDIIKQLISSIKIAYPADENKQIDILLEEIGNHYMENNITIEIIIIIFMEYPKYVKTKLFPIFSGDITLNDSTYQLDWFNKEMVINELLKLRKSVPSPSNLLLTLNTNKRLNNRTKSLIASYTGLKTKNRRKNTVKRRMGLANRANNIGINIVKPSFISKIDKVLRELGHFVNNNKRRSTRKRTRR